MPLSFLGLILLGACSPFSETGEPEQPFLGNWHSSYSFEHTLRDSLYRDTLNAYSLTQGLDLDAYFDIGKSHTPEQTAKFDSIFRSFSYQCPASVACDSVLWRETSTVTFTPDSTFDLAHRDSLLVHESRRSYTFDKDSIYFEFHTFKSAMHYVFYPDGNTLVLYDGALNDTLTRIPRL